MLAPHRARLPVGISWGDYAVSTARWSSCPKRERDGLPAPSRIPPPLATRTRIRRTDRRRPPPASWRGSMTYASPGPISTPVSSSRLMARRPDWTTPTWRPKQLSVPAAGLTHSDKRHPGSNVIRAAVVTPMRTTATCLLSGVLVSRRIEVARFHTGHGRLRLSIPSRSSRSPRRLSTTVQSAASRWRPRMSRL